MKICVDRQKYLDLGDGYYRSEEYCLIHVFR